MKTGFILICIGIVFLILVTEIGGVAIGLIGGLFGLAVGAAGAVIGLVAGFIGTIIGLSVGIIILATPILLIVGIIYGAMRLARS
jgi:hypothetical protein